MHADFDEQNPNDFSTTVVILQAGGFTLFVYLKLAKNAKKRCFIMNSMKFTPLFLLVKKLNLSELS